MVVAVAQHCRGELSAQTSPTQETLATARSEDNAVIAQKLDELVKQNELL